MEWIACSDRLPKIQEEIWVTDSHRIKKAWIWDHESGGVYFEYTNEDGSDFVPIWWKPLDKTCALFLAFEENTFKPKCDI